MRGFFLVCWLAGERWTRIERSRYRFASIMFMRNCSTADLGKRECFALLLFLVWTQMSCWGMGDGWGVRLGWMWWWGLVRGWAGCAFWSLRAHLIYSFVVVGETLFALGRCLRSAWMVSFRQAVARRDRLLLVVYAGSKYTDAQISWQRFCRYFVYRNLLPVFQRVSFPDGFLARFSIKLEQILIPRDWIVFIRLGLTVLNAYLKSRNEYLSTWVRL